MKKMELPTLLNTTLKVDFSLAYLHYTTTVINVNNFLKTFNNILLLLLYVDFRKNIFDFI